MEPSFKGSSPTQSFSCKKNSCSAASVSHRTIVPTADQVREEDPADRRLRRQRGVEGTADGPVASQQHGRDELGEGAETEVAEQLLAVYRVLREMEQTRRLSEKTRGKSLL